jgi:hypothetical protein
MLTPMNTAFAVGTDLFAIDGFINGSAQDGFASFDLTTINFDVDDSIRISTSNDSQAQSGLSINAPVQVQMATNPDALTIELDRGDGNWVAANAVTLSGELPGDLNGNRVFNSFIATFGSIEVSFASGSNGDAFAASTIESPIPSALIIFGSGLLGLLGIRKKMIS